MKKYNFTISTWFGEPNIEFRISHKVLLYIRERIITDILIPNNVYDGSSNDFIGIVVTTGKDIVNANLRGPEYDKKNSFISYGFHLPYNKIIDSKNELKSYIEFFFLILEELLKELGVSIEKIDELRINVLNEVIDNPEYVFKESYSTPNIEDILNELGLK